MEASGIALGDACSPGSLDMVLCINKRALSMVPLLTDDPTLYTCRPAKALGGGVGYRGRRAHWLGLTKFVPVAIDSCPMAFEPIMVEKEKTLFTLVNS